MKKTAIITFHNAVNYGAILQCYALQNFLEQKLYCSVDILDYQPIFFKKVFFDPMKPWQAYGLKNKLKAFIKCFLFNKEMRDLSRKHRELHRFMKEKLHLCPLNREQCDLYECYIAGSDQIWNLELLDNDTTYLLDFVKQGKKISYAASFKISDVDNFAFNAYEKYLTTFNSISVRETDLQSFLFENFKINSECVLDPTLLVGTEFWKKEVHNERLESEPYLMLYYVNKPEHLIEQAFSFANEHGLKVVSLNTIRNRKDYIDYSRASIEEFLNLIENSEVVFTTSFHGMAFSILYEKEFYYEVPEKSYNNNARLEDLALKLGLESQNLLKTNHSSISWTAVKEKLDFYRSLSEEFLSRVVL